MKKFIALSALVALLTGCTSRTEYGECIGVLQDKKPDLEYKLSGWNTFLAVIFSETIIVPVMVVANEHSCPVAKK
jgi:hypothetical protein